LDQKMPGIFDPNIQNKSNIWQNRAFPKLQSKNSMVF